MCYFCRHALIAPILFSAVAACPGDDASAIPDTLVRLFEQLDKHGRDKVADARFVELTLSGERGDRLQTDTAWLVAEDEDSITVLRDDLLPWRYSKTKTTLVPSSWSPREVKLESFKDMDFAAFCKELSEQSKEAGKAEVSDDVEVGPAIRLHAPGPSHRCLIAHAAWKRGIKQHVMPIVNLDTVGEGYQETVFDDLAWQHLLRGVNLLMFAERKEVLPHLRLVVELAPDSEYAAQAKDLTGHLERLVAEAKKARPQKNVDESKLSDEGRIRLYLAQLTDLRCPQMSQPGFINPYWAITAGELDRNPPTVKLKAMGIKAVPALIEALEDTTPTRTIYHWRDFARSRVVWRASDFAWHILRDITRRDFGNRRIVGFTFSSMSKEAKAEVISEIRNWYAENKDRSADEQMLAFFDSRNQDDWATAANYFMKRKDKRALKPLLQKIPLADNFNQGELCELAAQFGDESAKAVIAGVMKNADEASDRLSAAIALWKLGDDSGISLAIEFATAKEPAYGSWDEPTWFLMRTRSKEGMSALKAVVTKGPARQAAEIVEFITASITGDLYGDKREPAGCTEVIPILLAAIERKDYTGGSFNGIKMRISDEAAKALVLMREGADDDRFFGGRFYQPDPKLFDHSEADENKRDGQIEKIKKWYMTNRHRMVWDAERGKLVLGD